MEAGYEAYVLFVIQMENITHFEPNATTDPVFAEALCLAQRGGVKVMAAQCAVTPNSLVITTTVPVKL